MPDTAIWPVLPGSSSDFNVLLPVELVRSAVEVQAPNNAVNKAVAVLGDGVGGGWTGQAPAVFSPPVSCARLALPTTWLFALNSAEPEPPAPIFPRLLTTPQNVES